MLKRFVVVVSAGAMVAACGGSSDTMPSATPAATFTITTSGISPKSVTVARGSQVQFINNDNTFHDMESNPHPEHTDCPEINSVGFLSPGQSRQTGNLNTARTCGFHDHDNPNNTAVQGSIVIQ
jgi:plastocyanin